MDSVTQFSLGAALAVAMMGRKVGPQAIFFGGIIATLPDLDSLIPVGNVIDNVTYHRGASHSLFTLTALTPVITWLGWRFWPKLKQTISFKHLMLTVFFCLITHILLDSLTSYGTQIFWPLNTPPVAIPSIFIIDPIYTGLLLFGIISFWRLCRKNYLKKGLNRNKWGLILSSIYLIFGISSHFIIQQKAMNYSAFTGARLHVSPMPFNLIYWRVLALEETRYKTAVSSLFTKCPFMNVKEFPRTMRHKGQKISVPYFSSLKRFEWFTNGFYTYGPYPPVDSPYYTTIISDLRIGHEQLLPFSFAISSIGMDGFKVIDPPVYLNKKRHWKDIKQVYFRPLKCAP